MRISPRRSSSLALTALVGLAVLGAVSAAFAMPPERPRPGTHPSHTPPPGSHTSQPAPAEPTGSYAFPFRADELNTGERFQTQVHESGIQAMGKDIVIRHFNGKYWSVLTETNTNDKDVNAYLDYGRPFYAMEDGVVVGCWRNAPNNVPGSYNPLYTANRYAGGGNHLWILQTDGVYALYAHAKPGSIPSAICPHDAELFSGTARTSGPPPGEPDIDPQVVVRNGAHIKKGQLLGDVGNAGATEQMPHLHVHMEKNGAPWPMTFERGLTIPYDTNSPKLTGPWKPVAGHTLPNAPILVWPPHSMAAHLHQSNVSDADYQAQFDHYTDSGFMPDTISCSDHNGLMYDINWVPTSGSWMAKAGMDDGAAAIYKSQALSQRYHETSTYTCNTSSGPRTVKIFRK